MKEEIIQEIKESIEKNSSTFTSMGVTKGVAGISLFYYYYIKFTNNTLYSKHLITHLENSISGLNNEYKGNNIVTDIIEIADLLHLFCKDEIVCRKDIQFYFENFNPVISDLLADEINNKNISPHNGAIKLGNYFLNENAYPNLIISVLNLVKSQAIYHEDSKGVYWCSSFERKGRYLVELSGSHGSTGIANFLLTTYKSNIEKEKTKELIIKALNYLLYHRSTSNSPQFPFDSESIESSQNYNLAYGDLSIGYIFLKAGKILNHQEFYNVGIDILKNFSNFRDEKREFIRDANILYGSSGLSSIFRQVKSELNRDDFNPCIDYWFERTIKFKSNSSEWAGYSAYYNQFDVNTPLSLTDGIIGIGISYMEQMKDLRNFHYLNFLNYSI